VFIFAQDIVVMVPWRKDGKDNAEGMLIAAHHWEKFLYFIL
jgi:hypothetical protein